MSINRARVVGDTNPSRRFIVCVVVRYNGGYAPRQEVETHQGHGVVNPLLQFTIGEGPHTCCTGNQPPHL